LIFKPLEKDNTIHLLVSSQLKSPSFDLIRNTKSQRKIAPTVSIIHKEIKDSIKISMSKLTLTLIDLGYTYTKIGDNPGVKSVEVTIL
jgi:hypothetical protein